jgi:hypothetical protein
MMKKLALVLCLSMFSPYAQACNPEVYRWNAKRVPIYFNYDPERWHAEFFSSMRRWNESFAAIALEPGFPGGLGPICMETNTTMFVKSVCDKNWEPGVLAVTLIRYNSSTGGALVGKILFNSHEKYDIYRGPARPGKPDFQRVTLHEMGHFLGLGHETRVASIMAPKISNTEFLTPDDVACLKKVYPGPQPVLGLGEKR